MHLARVTYQCIQSISRNNPVINGKEYPGKSPTAYTVLFSKEIVAKKKDDSMFDCHSHAPNSVRSGLRCKDIIRNTATYCTADAVDSEWTFRLSILLHSGLEF